MIARVFKPPMYTPIDDRSNRRTSFFLGGSIDMGSAIDWQKMLINTFAGAEVDFYNPRRDDWDASWIQDPTPGTQFYEQVTWEMTHQEKVDYNIYYFADDSKSPITLLELGKYGNDDNTIVRCNKNFYRYGNVKALCDRYGIMIVESDKELIEVMRDFIE